jgi:hypothetical protein
VSDFETNPSGTAERLLKCECALLFAQSAFYTLINPTGISKTSIISAYAMAIEAEKRCRDALAKETT